MYLRASNRLWARFGSVVENERRRDTRVGLLILEVSEIIIHLFRSVQPLTVCLKNLFILV